MLLLREQTDTTGPTKLSENSKYDGGLLCLLYDQLYAKAEICTVSLVGDLPFF